MTPSFRAELESLRDFGFQPMYNGRPSCPFCCNFIDEEETHEPGCPLVVALEGPCDDCGHELDAHVAYCSYELSSGVCPCEADA